MLGANYIRKDCSAIYIKGFDTLEIGLKMEHYDNQMSPFLDKLKHYKQMAQEKKPSSLTIGDLSLEVKPTGQKFYAYRLECNDFHIAFMDKSFSTNPPIFVKFFSSFIWSYGLEGAYSKFLNWFDSFSPTNLTVIISRVDPCFDSDQIKFIEKDMQGIVTRAKSKTKYLNLQEFSYGKCFSGFSIGSRKTLHARIYNKSLEISKSGKIWFKEIWESNGWNKTSDIWRVEFELRRPILKEFNITTIDDLLSKYDELWVYLTQHWLSIKTPNHDNVSRWKTKRKWKLVQTLGCNYCVSPLIRETIKQGNLAKLLDQATGLLLTISALSDSDSISTTSRVISSYCQIKLSTNNETFHSEMKKRREKFINSVEVNHEYQ